MSNKTKYPDGYMKIMKRKKRKKLRNTPIDKTTVEQKHNDAEREL